MKAPNLMYAANRSAGIPNQARAALERIAQLEVQRQRHLSHGQVAKAAVTLGAMAQTFEKAPTTEELRAVVANEMPRGEMISGRAYYDNLTTGKEVSTYFVGATAPDKMREYLRTKNLQSAMEYAVPKKLVDFVQGGVQAAAYHYATAQQREVGSGLGATMPMSTADEAANLLRARERAAYLVSVSALHGLGALGGMYEDAALMVLNAVIDVAGKGGDVENNVAAKLTESLDAAEKRIYNVAQLGPLVPPIYCQWRKSVRQIRGVREGFNKALSARGAGPLPACPDETTAPPAQQQTKQRAAPPPPPPPKTNWLLIGGIIAGVAALGGGAWYLIRRRRA